MDLAVGRNRFEPTILIDLTIYRHGDPLVTLPPHLGEVLTEHAQELADVGCLDFEFFGPTRMDRMTDRNPNTFMRRQPR